MVRLARLFVLLAALVAGLTPAEAHGGFGADAAARCHGAAPAEVATASHAGHAMPADAAHHAAGPVAAHACVCVIVATLPLQPSAGPSAMPGAALDDEAVPVLVGRKTRPDPPKPRLA